MPVYITGFSTSCIILFPKLCYEVVLLCPKQGQEKGFNRNMQWIADQARLSGTEMPGEVTGDEKRERKMS